MAGVSHPALGCSSRESSRSIDILHGENVRECTEEEWHEEYKQYKTKPLVARKRSSLTHCIARTMCYTTEHGEPFLLSQLPTGHGGSRRKR